MSERYGPCPYCRGAGVFEFSRKSKSGEIITRECGLCEGTGFDGWVITYMQKEADSDWEREKPEFYQRKGIL